MQPEFNEHTAILRLQSVPGGWEYQVNGVPLIDPATGQHAVYSGCVAAWADEPKLLRRIALAYTLAQTDGTQS